MTGREPVSEEAIRVGRYLAEFSPPSYRDRFSEEGWAEIVECVWAAEEVLLEREESP